MGTSEPGGLLLPEAPSPVLSTPPVCPEQQGPKWFLGIGDGGPQHWAGAAVQREPGAAHPLHTHVIYMLTGGLKVRHQTE